VREVRGRVGGGGGGREEGGGKSGSLPVLMNECIKCEGGRGEEGGGGGVLVYLCL